MHTPWVFRCVLFTTAFITLGLEILFSRLVPLKYGGISVAHMMPFLFLGLSVGGTIAVFRQRGHDIEWLCGLLPWLGGASIVYFYLQDNLLVELLLMMGPFVAAGWIFSQAYMQSEGSLVYALDMAGLSVGVVAVYLALPILGAEGVAGALVLVACAQATLAQERVRWLSAGTAGAVVLLLGYHGGLFSNGAGGLDFFAVNPKTTDFMDWYGPNLRSPPLQGKVLTSVASKWSLIARSDLARANFNFYEDIYGKEWESRQSTCRRNDLYRPDAHYYLTYNGVVLAPVDMPTVCAPYAQLLPNGGRVLLVGAGGGRDLRELMESGAGDVVAAEITPSAVTLLQRPDLQFAYQEIHRTATIRPVDGRTLIHYTRDSFDLIMMSFAELYIQFPETKVFLETYLYTTEAMAESINRLDVNGILIVTKFLADVAQDNGETLKLFATALEGLRATGVEHAERHVMLLERESPIQPGRRFLHLYVGRQPLTPALEGVIADSRAEYDVAYAPSGHGALSGNDSLPGRLNSVARRFQAGSLDRLYGELPVNIRPATDDKPFFYNLGLLSGLVFFRWLLLAAIALLGIPFVWGLVRSGAWRDGRVWRMLAFMGLLGVGYSTFQACMIQKLNVFLGNPVYSLLVVSAGLPAGAAFGAHATRHWRTQQIRLATVGWAVLGLVFQLALPSALEVLYTDYVGLRMVFGLVLLLPLAVGVGIQYPHGMQLVRGTVPAAPGLLYSFNSLWLVVASAALLEVATRIGFAWVFCLALGCYVAAALMLRRT